MQTKTLFGTDGVRGKANTELTPELAYNLGRAGAYVLTKANNSPPNILTGTDSRISGDMLEAALIAGMCSVGASVASAGILPSPAIAYLTRKNKFDAGVIISASHNVFSDNGIKFFSNTGYKLTDETEAEIEALIADPTTIPRVLGENVGKRLPAANFATEYANYLKNIITTDFSGLKIALDCANGATSFIAPELFTNLGANVVTINNAPNGININANCGSTHPEGLVEAVKAHSCDIGIAFDGDGDRLICVDETGKIIDGDHFMAICGLHMKETNSLPHNTIVTTVMSNFGLFEMAKKHNLTLEQTAVGDRYVLERMLAGGFAIGGEQSGHIIFSKHATTGDGILSALMLVSIMKTKAQPLSQLTNVLELFPQVLVGAKVPNDKKQLYKNNATIQSSIEQLNEKYQGVGRILVRPSGTEPLVRVMIEGKNLAEITNDAKNLAAEIEKLSNS